nr:MAG TPA: hypothetical protein [Caudoviricetes sp.]
MCVLSCIKDSTLGFVKSFTVLIYHGKTVDNVDSFK